PPDSLSPRPITPQHLHASLPAGSRNVEQPPGGAFPHPGNLAQFRCPVTNLAALAVEGHSEAMGFVSNKLDQMQHRVVVVERNRIIFLSTDVTDLLALGDGSERLIDDLQ